MTTLTVGARLLGSGSALPARVVTNDELAKKVDTTDEWIVARTGIRQRYIAGEGETTATLATAAAASARANRRRVMASPGRGSGP